MKLHLVSLGCAKNLVDSEVMIGRLMQRGWMNTPNPEKADVIIINTCSFIESAINESIDTILELARYKQTGACQRLIVAGCLPERFREEIIDALPEVDFFLGTGAFSQIVQAVLDPLNASRCLLPDPYLIPLQKPKTQRVLSSSNLAYIKIAEGCNRHCTYCIIPKLRGKQRSRNLEDIVAEARSLVSAGIKELILIAQDTTSYGNDLKPPIPLNRLLEDMSSISDNVWVRFLYGHPESIDESLIRTVAKYQNICSYFDIPIQHVSDSILKKMGRNYSSDSLRILFDKIRSFVSDAALRTTVLIGFPGETDEYFKELIDFIQEVQFDHIGAFIYSDAQDLPSHHLSDHIPNHIAQDRYDQLMSCQAEISLQMNRKHIGAVYDVLIEKALGDNLFSGRTFFQAPEVDGTTYIHSEQLEIGSFVNARIVDALEYDLTGEVA